MNNLNLNIFNILIIAGVIHGIIFSLIIFLNKNFSSKPNQYIALTVLALSISNLQYWFADVGFNGWLDLFNKIRIPCDTLIVPFFYLFVNNYLNHRITKQTWIILFTPFFIILIANVIMYGNPYAGNGPFRVLNIIIDLLSLIFNIILIIHIYILLAKYEKKEYDKNTVKKNIRWLKNILTIGLLLCSFWLAEIIYMQSKYNSGGFSIYYPLWISISILIYWISYVGIHQSKIHAERKKIRVSNLGKKEKLNSNIEILQKDIINHIKENKLYLNPNLSLKLLSEEFNLSEGYISQLINSNTKFNFNDLINRLRVEESKSLLTNPEYSIYTIESIVLECGFNSKSSFYQAFKKFEGKTPSIFKKEVRNL